MAEPVSVSRITAAVAVIAAMLGMAAEAALAKAPFRVADSIEMTVLADPDATHAGFFPQEIKRSPDGRHFFIVTRKGDLKTGANEHRLLVYDVEAVRRSLAGGALPKPAELARF